MFTSFDPSIEVVRDRQREMLARAEGQRAARQFHAQSRAAKVVGRPRQRLRRALRVVFSSQLARPLL